MENLDYDSMLNKMNLRYLNGNFYKNQANTPLAGVVGASPVAVSEPISKEAYQKWHQQKQLEKRVERAKIQLIQKEKRKLLLISDSERPLRINSSANVQLRLRGHG